jgi:hypothetical protein
MIWTNKEWPELPKVISAKVDLKIKGGGSTQPIVFEYGVEMV